MDGLPRKMGAGVKVGAGGNKVHVLRVTKELKYMVTGEEGMIAPIPLTGCRHGRMRCTGF